EGSVSREVTVSRVELDAYVVGPSGDPIADLTPADFKVLVDGRPARLESAEWIPADRSEGDVAPAAPEPEEPVASAPAGPAVAEGPRYAPGRLIVLFFQTDFQKARLMGLV